MATIVENPGSTMRPANVKAGAKDLIGIAFPFRKADGEFPKRARNTDAVRNDLITLFNTPIRSRVMRPSVGTNVHSLVFEAKGPLLRAMLERNIRQTIANNEPRVRVVRLNFAATKTQITVTVHYLIQGVKDSIAITLDRAA